MVNSPSLIKGDSGKPRASASPGSWALRETLVLLGLCHLFPRDTGLLYHTAASAPSTHIGLSLLCQEQRPGISQPIHIYHTLSVCLKLHKVLWSKERKGDASVSPYHQDFVVCFLKWEQFSWTIPWTPCCRKIQLFVENFLKVAAYFPVWVKRAD